MPSLFAEQRSHVPLQPKICNATRWSSTFELLRRHINFFDYVVNVNDCKIDLFLLNTAGKRRVEKLLKNLAKLDAGTKPKQHDNVTIRSARAYFDTVWKNHVTLSSCLDFDAQFFRDTLFSSLIFKIRKI